MKLVPYIRQSRAKERTISLEERRAIHRWAKDAGVSLAREVVEQGVSGNKPWRERGLGEAIKACEKGRCAPMLVTVDRRAFRNAFSCRSPRSIPTG